MSARSTASVRTDLVLLYPPWPVLDDRAILQNSLPPLGILSIAAYAEQLGYTVRVHDLHGEKLGDDELRRRLRRDQPRFVGISVLTNMAIPALKIARICKAEVSDCVVIAGGVHALFISYVTTAEVFSINVPLTVILMSVLGGARNPALRGQAWTSV